MLFVRSDLRRSSIRARSITFRSIRASWPVRRRQRAERDRQRNGPARPDCATSLRSGPPRRALDRPGARGPWGRAQARRPGGAQARRPGRRREDPGCGCGCRREGRGAGAKTLGAGAGAGAGAKVRATTTDRAAARSGAATRPVAQLIRARTAAHGADV